ncbi:hypothetical protein Tsubulata_030641 [Turnera subulata]|uniref:Lipoxygenase n=1 Tax=Turnera subulata TaxID=218843 RepID=A0A9Q0JB93_9ROSI|nr:hypothetical protein Tsubulata_030641 [Turnera subulata]
MGSYNPLSNLTSLTKTETGFEVRAVITVKVTVGGLFDNIGVTRPLDEINEAVSTAFLLELVSSQLDANGEEKETIQAYASKISQTFKQIRYAATFTVPEDFGEVGALMLENQLRKEVFIKDIVLEGFPAGPFTVFCDSWAHSKSVNPTKRVFFTNKSYLPSETPEGLRSLREQELENLRGNGQGERQPSDRIYDYDKYNDLGDPDSTPPKARPVLGGHQHPYPRRCRTGRPPTQCVKKLRALLNAFLPGLQAVLTDNTKKFRFFTEIDNLYSDGDCEGKDKDEEDDEDSMPKRGFKLPSQLGTIGAILPTLIKIFREGGDAFLLFDLPGIIDKDRFSWLTDEEFARQTLAGLNPLSIQLVTEQEWPLRSKLDPKVYGPPESLITEEIIEREISDCMTFREALKQNKLFMLDYHDLLLPYVSKVREIDDTILYGSRTVFFLTEEGTLRPVAIELTRPPIGDKPQWKEVYTPSYDTRMVGCGGWQKLMFVRMTLGTISLSVTEPYIIAANRQLSAMHPVHRLLKPHFRYTMEINALARGSLINADGIIEKTFAPREYCIELSSVAYDKLWRFDREALPADLIARGMAVEDKDARHGLRLTIEDYPYANDGLVLWDATKEWVSDYVDFYYPEECKVESDQELQAWWTEVRTKGHEDKKNEPWWPVLNTKRHLVQVLTTIIWVASAHHAGVNFGQYEYGGYFPNHPSIARTNMPTEDSTEEKFKEFLKHPEDALLQCFPSQLQALQVTAVLDILSSHSPDEEYIGGKLEPSWEDEPEIKAAFERFSGKLMELEGIIDARNSDFTKKNRTGAGVIPYELLKPYSTAGVTGKGVPNSISI